MPSRKTPVPGALQPDEAGALLERALFEVKKVIVGQDRLVERLLTALLAGGHCLLEGVPGVAKTLAAETLAGLGVPHEVRILSAHRTPDRLAEYAKSARGRGLRVIVAGAGGAAHLPGMCAAWTSLPVLGVPVESQALRGQDSLLSIVQMPAGIPVGTLAIGRAGAVNAGLLAAAILATTDPALADRLDALRAEQTAAVAETPA